MKKNMVMGAFAAFLLTAAGCSENETELGGDDGNNSEKVMLGVTTELGGITKAAVGGNALTYDNYATAPGLGIYITNKDLTDWYTPDAGGAYIKEGKAVWFMGNGEGQGWKSIQARGASFAAATEVPYFLTKEVGQVYAYYPYDPAISVIDAVGAAGANLKIPVTVKETGAIDADTNNASKVYNAGRWTSNTTNGKKILGDADEKDYLYYDGGLGRYVNNGRADGQPAFNPANGAANTNADNPGYLVDLEMYHGMSMISFRIYDGGKLSGNPSTFTKFVVRNKTGVNAFKTGAANMSLLDGSILTPANGTGILTRTVTSYTLMRQIEAGGTESETAFIATSSITPQTVCKRVSALVYPVTFNDEEIEVEITLHVDSEDQVFTVTLPGNTWEKNNNYVYTLMAGRNKLEVVTVTVSEWAPMEQEEIPL